MKVGSILENNVTDLGKFKQKKHDDHIKDVNRKIEALKSEMFANIDMAVAATIDKLTSRGMSHEEASKKVYGHLSDLVTGYDIGGDF